MAPPPLNFSVAEGAATEIFSGGGGNFSGGDSIFSIGAVNVGNNGE